MKWLWRKGAVKELPRFKVTVSIGDEISVTVPVRAVDERNAVGVACQAIQRDFPELQGVDFDDVECEEVKEG